MTVFVYFTPVFKTADGSFPHHFYACYFFLMVIGYILECTSWVSQMGYWAKTSDPSIGGTHLCFIAMVSNIGLL
jgi:hypothetical protein